jgi:hypothetical protein
MWRGGAEGVCPQVSRVPFESVCCRPWQRCKYHGGIAWLAQPWAAVGCRAHAFPPLPVLWLDEIMR